MRPVENHFSIIIFSLSWHRTKFSVPFQQLEYPEEAVESFLDSPLDELVAAHLRACWAVSKRDFVEAYKCQALAGERMIVFSSFLYLNLAPLSYGRI